MLLYRIFLLIYQLGIRVVAPFNRKAALWLDGRKGWRAHIQRTLTPGEKRIWIHCSSLGEFEQGRPLIEATKQTHPSYKIVLTFFSPSGYEACKNYALADYIFYLPADGAGAARDFTDLIKPSLVLFVKYEFWYFYLTTLRKRNIPTLLVSAAFRAEQPFFKWYGNLFRKMLNCFTHIHVQNEASKQLLASIGVTQVSVSGDTRYDRVQAIAQKRRAIPEAEQFCGGSPVLIAGSTWPGDEEILAKCIAVLPTDWKVIIAPHEIDESHIAQIEKLFEGNTVRFSRFQSSHYPDKRLLIIDNIGMLSALYAYGSIAWVGGGFEKGGIHNTLEPATFGLAVIFGPIYQKFVEAVALADAGAAFAVNDEQEAASILKLLSGDKNKRAAIKALLTQFMNDHTGASTRIMQQIAAAEWLAV